MKYNMAGKTAEKVFVTKYCEGREEGHYTSEDIKNAFRAGRAWNLSLLFLDARNKPRPNSSDIVIMFRLGDEVPFCFEYEFVVTRGYAYDETIERSPYIPVCWFRLDSVLKILNVSDI